MSKRLPVLTAKEITKALKKKGFYFVRQKGSHQVWTNGIDKWTTVPMHPGENIGRGLLSGILRDLKITRDEFLKLIKK